MQIEKRMDGWLLQITERQQSAIRPSVQTQPIQWKSVVVASRADMPRTPGVPWPLLCRLPSAESTVAVTGARRLPPL